MFASSLPHASLGPRFVAALAMALAACSANSDPPATVQAKITATAETTLNTFIGAGVCLQIDQQTAGGLDGADANLVVGLDYDKSVSVNAPSSTKCTSWTDWTAYDPAIDANHRLLDQDNADGRDPTAFPRSDSCVGPANVVSKMDLGYVGAASNNDFVYLDVMRRSNLGDAGYVWVFTKLAPDYGEDLAVCRAGEKLLQFKISTGDVLVFGHYKTGGGPLLRVFTAKERETPITLDAVGAINFENGSVWTETPTAIAAVAVNTTTTDPGTWGLAGAVKPVKGGYLDTELFAEAAITTATFTGGGSACGATYWAAVITRSSGSGGTSPDVKDVAGPAMFNFGSVDVTAKAEPNCNNQIKLTATVTANGTVTETAKCTWQELDAAGKPIPEKTLEGCTVTVENANGEHSYLVEATTVDGCTKKSSVVKAAAFAAPTVKAAMDPSCEETVEYGATPSDVNGDASYAWSFTGCGPAAAPTAQSGKIASPADALCTGEVVLTVQRGALVCTASASATATAYKPIAVTLAAAAAPAVCAAGAINASLEDAVTFVATPSGGHGAYAYTWLLDDTPLDASVCSTATCTVHPAESVACTTHKLAVTVEDQEPECLAKTSNAMKYQKLTGVAVGPYPGS